MAMPKKLRKSLLVALLLAMATAPLLAASAPGARDQEGSADPAGRGQPAVAPRPIDPELKAIFDADTLFSGGGRVLACQQVEGAKSGLQQGQNALPKEASLIFTAQGACTVTLVCGDNTPEYPDVQTCSSATGNCSATCGYVKCDGHKHSCNQPCCSEAITCPDGSPLSCATWRSPSCSKDSTSVTCDGSTQSCPSCRCSPQAQLVCRNSGGVCGLDPGTGICGCYYP
jgi:hypothetical protein